MKIQGVRLQGTKLVPSGVATDEYFNLVALLLPGTGTNGAQNNTFVDSSTNNFTVTRTGNTAQGTFSPFSQTGWSGYFDGTGDYLSAASNAAFNLGTGDYTYECWVYKQTSSRVMLIAVASAGFSVAINTSGNIEVCRSLTAIDFTFTAGVPNNQWTHIAVSRSGTSLQAFMNGTSLGTQTSSTSYGQGICYIGIDANGSSTPYLGYISNMRLVKGTAVYTANFTPPTAPLTAISGTSLLTCQSNRFIDNSSNAFAITVTGNTAVQAFAPFDPTTAYASATNGGSGFFTGTSSTGYLSLTQAASNAIFPSGGTGGFTIEFWFFPAATSSTFNSVIAGAWTGTVGQVWWEINCGSTGFNITLGNNGFGSGSGNIQSSTPFIANQWTHVVLQRRSNGTSWDVYQNGVNVSANQTSPNNFNLYSVAPIRIAYGYGNTVLSSLTAFYLANFRITNSQVYSSNFTPPTEPLPPISGTSLLLNYINGGIIDATAKNALETVGNASISTTQSKFGGSSMAFDGTGDGLSLPANQNISLGTGDFTIEMWVNGANSSSPVGGSFPRLFTLGTAQGTGCIEVYNSSSTGITVAISAGTNITFAGGTLLDSTWNHFAITRSGTSLKAFVNGTQVGSTNTNSTNLNLAASTQSWIGSISASAGNFTGYIDDFRITRGYARYTANFTPPTQALPTL